METKKTTIEAREQNEPVVTEQEENGKVKQNIIALLKGKLKLIIIFGVVAAGIIVLAIIGNQKNGSLTTISESTLQEVIEINELSTVDYTYNAITKKVDKNNNPMYYVAYEGTVTAGIDFNKIEFEVDEKEKKVIITLPEIEIHSTKVEMGTLEYIFTKNKYETEDITQEAYKLCKDDLKTRIESESELYNTARENAISSVEALFNPWIDTVDDEYTVEIK